jgi:hypothetical protein
MTIVIEPESFIVDKTPNLLPGEIERVARWADEVAALVEPRVPVAV